MSDATQTSSARGRARRNLSRALATLLLVAIGAPSCAPPSHPVALDAGTLRSRYLDELASRERAAHAFSAELALWPGLAGRHLPGVLATLTVSAPDRCRLRVASPGGTLIDAVGARDSLWAWLPGGRTLVDLTACADSAGLADLPTLAVRIAAALWRPAPGDSAAGDPPVGSSHALAWAEHGRSIRVGLSSEGLPDTVTLTRGGESVRIAYLAWMRTGSVRLPGEIRVLADSARASLRCQVSRVHLHDVPEASDFRRPGPRDEMPESGCEWWHELMSGGSP